VRVCEEAVKVPLANVPLVGRGADTSEGGTIAFWRWMVSGVRVKMSEPRKKMPFFVAADGARILGCWM